MFQVCTTATNYIDMCMRCESKVDSDPVMPSDVYIWGSNSSHQVFYQFYDHEINLLLVLTCPVIKRVILQVIFDQEDFDYHKLCLADLWYGFTS